MTLSEVYNSKYLFISKGIWYKQGTEVKIDDNDTLFFITNDYEDIEIPYETLIDQQNKIYGGFRGIRIKQHESESKKVKIGEEYEDGEVCNLSEFIILKR